MTRLSEVAKREMRQSTRLSAGAERLCDLQEIEAERRAAMAAASKGDLAALVGWTVKFPGLGGSVSGGIQVTDADAPPRDTGLVVGLIKKKLLVRLDDGREELVKPLLKPHASRGFFFTRKKDKDEPVPIALVERIGYYHSRSPPTRTPAVV